MKPIWTEGILLGVVNTEDNSARISADMMTCGSSIMNITDIDRYPVRQLPSWWCYI